MPQEPNEPQSTSQNPESPAGQSAQQGSASQNLSSQRALRSPLVVLMRGIIQIKRGIRLQIINQILRMDTALVAMEEMRLVQAMCSERAIRQVQEMLRQAFTGDTERPMVQWRVFCCSRYSSCACGL